MTRRASPRDAKCDLNKCNTRRSKDSQPHLRIGSCIIQRVAVHHRPEYPILLQLSGIDFFFKSLKRHLRNCCSKRSLIFRTQRPQNTPRNNSHHHHHRKQFRYVPANRNNSFANLDHKQFNRGAHSLNGCNFTTLVICILLDNCVHEYFKFMNVISCTLPDYAVNYLLENH